jgi:hypothetical protein
LDGECDERHFWVGMKYKMKNLRIGQTFHTFDKVAYCLASSSSPQRGREFEHGQIDNGQISNIVFPFLEKSILEISFLHYKCCDLIFLLV